MRRLPPAPEKTTLKVDLEAMHRARKLAVRYRDAGIAVSPAEIMRRAIALGLPLLESGAKPRLELPSPKRHKPVLRVLRGETE